MKTKTRFNKYLTLLFILALTGCDSDSKDSTPTHTDTPNQEAIEMMPNGGAEEEHVDTPTGDPSIDEAAIEEVTEDDPEDPVIVTEPNPETDPTTHEIQTACEAYCEVALDCGTARFGDGDQTTGCLALCRDKLTSDELHATPQHLASCLEAQLANNACNFPRFESCMLEAESDTAAFAGNLGATVCESLYECCPDAEAGLFDGTCSYIGFAWWSELEANISGGFIEFDPSAGAACLEAMREEISRAACENSGLDIEELFRTILPCQQAIVPQHGEGGSCSRLEYIEEDDEFPWLFTYRLACDPGLICAPDETKPNEFTCQNLVNLGNRCTSNEVCGEQGFCSEIEDGSTVCKIKKETGASCHDDLECTSNICYPNDDGENVCTPLDIRSACEDPNQL